MRFIEYIEKLETIKYLAKSKRAGKCCQMAAKLDVSERTLRRMLQQLRKSGFSIKYNRFRRTYEMISESNKEKIFA